ncbi:unnamed protein product [Protopolystoma xenopodis]|uniref:Uncharacterized protein n=1 Tax=Protopolystoma xenopodis TaxID=117903 RepID=A0A3S5CJD4_9PLAT|nr:unnamed protein product [Protopolystoma xenopodis]
MTACCGDVCQGGTDERLAQVDLGRRTVSRRLLHTMQQFSLRGNPLWFPVRPFQHFLSIELTFAMEIIITPTQ